MDQRVETAEIKPETEEEKPARLPDLIEFELIDPIMAYGEEVKVLKIRKPTGADLLRIGNPIKIGMFSEPPTIDYDFPKVIAMVARLTNIPSPSLEKLSTDQMVALAITISPFFMPTLRAN
jgi:hypothetical protein